MSDPISYDAGRLLPEIFTEHLPSRSSPLDREDLLDLIEKRVEELMDRQTDLLLSSLYRMDVAEGEIENVMSGRTGESIPSGLARLILDRQIKRLETQATYRKKDNNFEWGPE